MSERAGTARRPSIRLLHLAIAVAIAVWGLGLLLTTLVENSSFYHDDAYITLRYARNWLAGRGLVWNPGEYVQGYSNFLYLVLVSLPAALGLGWVESTRLVSATAFCAMVLLCLVFPGLRREPGVAVNHPLRALPALLVLTSVSLAVWTLGGLEGPLFALFVTSGALCFLRTLAQDPSPAASKVRARAMLASGLFFGLGSLTRPDGLVFLLGTLLYLGLRKNPGKGADLLRLAAIPLALLIPYGLWTSSYYGDLLPNTYYVKVAGAIADRLMTGLGYTGWYLVSAPFSVLSLSALMALSLRRKGLAGLSLETRYLAWLILLYLAAISYVGGDHMTSFRLFAPLVPLTSLLAFSLLRDLVPSNRTGFAWGVYAVALLLASSQLLGSTLNPRRADAAAMTGEAVARYINRCWPSGATIALNTAGSTPYFADDYRYIDMLGLNDRTIARREISRFFLDWQRIPGHAKGDGRYVLSRKPDFVIIGPASGGLISRPWFLSDVEMAQDPSFRKNYALREVLLARQGPVTEETTPGNERPTLFRYYQRSDQDEISCAPQADMS